MESSTTTIDDLPEAILLHIISILPTTTAVLTTAVARRWRNLWRSVPILEFDVVDFYDYIPDKSLRDGRLLFVQFISQTILLRFRHLPLEKFYLFFDYKNYDFMRAYVNSWVQYAVSSRTPVLHLNFIDYCPVLPQFCSDREIENGDCVDTNPGYPFHFSDLMNSSVKVLKLRCCVLSFPSNALPMMFDSIREVHLLELYSTDAEIETLMNVCINIEVLSLVDVWYLPNLKIVSPKLKHLELGFFDERKDGQNSVEIYAPNLESIKLRSVYIGKYTFKPTACLVQARVDFDDRGWVDFDHWTHLVSLLRSVQRLTIENMWNWIVYGLEEESIGRNDEEIEKNPDLESDEELTNWRETFKGKLKLGEEVFSGTFLFNNFKHLKLLTGYTRRDILGLEFLLKSCSQLEIMVLVY